MKIIMWKRETTAKAYGYLEINKKDYPQLDGMSNQEATIYLNENIHEFKLENYPYQNISDQLYFEGEELKSKTTDEEYEIILVDEPLFNCTGKWFQGDSEGEMNINISIEMGEISGVGEDRVGKFEIHGYLMGTDVTFKKSYINKHTLIYFGKSISKNDLYEGEWYLTNSGSKGRFEIKIPRNL